MKIVLPFFGFLFISLSSNAQKAIELKDLSQHVGDSVEVLGIVQQASSQTSPNGSFTSLQFVSSSGQQAIVVIWDDNSKSFRMVPKRDLPGREVRISGRVELVNSKACIVVRNEQELSVILSERGPNQ